MAKEMVIQILCDVHLRRRQERVLLDARAELPPITLGGITRVLTLCPECRGLQLSLDEWAEILRQCGTLVGQEARPPSAATRRALAAEADTPPATDLPPAPAANDMSCPFPGCERFDRPYTSRPALSSHLGKAHHTKLSLLPGGRPRKAETPKPCTFPGCGHIATTGSGLSSHLRGHESDNAQAS